MREVKGREIGIGEERTAGTGFRWVMWASRWSSTEVSRHGLAASGAFSGASAFSLLTLDFSCDGKNLGICSASGIQKGWMNRNTPLDLISIG